MPRLVHFLLLAIGTAACAPLQDGLHGELMAGYAQFHVDGQVALNNAGSSSGTSQDLESAFGIGAEQGSAYLRGVVDLGVPVLSASAFWFHERGAGVLDADFGGIGSATPVTSNLEFSCIKLASAFDLGLDIGPLSVTPGIALDAFDLRFAAQEPIGGREEIDERIGLPLAFVRATAELGVVDLIGEVGYLQLPGSIGAHGRFLDLDALAEVAVGAGAFLFVGYRRLELHATDDTAGQTFDLDLRIGGWTAGGGIRF